MLVPDAEVAEEGGVRTFTVDLAGLPAVPFGAYLLPGIYLLPPSFAHTFAPMWI